MNNTKHPADLKSIFKREYIPVHIYELFKAVVSSGVCTGVEALMLFRHGLIPSLFFSREEKGVCIKRRIYKDIYGDILVVPKEGMYYNSPENGYDILQRYLYEDCFTFSFWTPSGAKVNERVFSFSKVENSWWLVTSLWEPEEKEGKSSEPQLNLTN